jgi:hypothetical protein
VTERRSVKRPIRRDEQAAAYRAWQGAPRRMWLRVWAATGKAYPCRCPEHHACDGRPDPEREAQFFCSCAGRRARQNERCCGGHGPDSAWGRARKFH